MENHKLSPLFTQQQIQEKIKELANQITQKINGEPLTAVCILKGSFIFFADLIRQIPLDITCDFLGVSSYQGTQSSGEVKISLDLASPVKNQNLLLVEDIVDTGLTMNYLQKNLASRGPKSITTVALLNKPGMREVECQIDFFGFNIGNDFVVGYGLDYNGFYRNLPYIAQIQDFN
ncbi:MAG: hypoxanthine phosphoribosyltransferase [Bdellovibrio sp.]|nr:MAG: hypoxanthine phosphoribosyltransferase [Bdellovibrio sp.]